MTHQAVSFPLYDHIKRPAWGPGMLLWERDEKRGYLFEDGGMRVIAKPYFDLLKLSQSSADDLVEMFQRRISEMDLSQAREIFRTAERSRFTLDEQAQLFLGMYPGGFAGSVWQEKHRGAGVKKRLKRHRTVAVTEASEVLSEARLSDALSSGTHRELWEQICEMLRRTDLVPVKEVKVLQKNLDRAGPRLTTALRDLLVAPLSDSEDKADEFMGHFNGFIKELSGLLNGGLPSWPLATVLLAQYSPKTHVCVHPSSLSHQSKWMKRAAIRNKKPSALEYLRARSFILKLAERLEALGVAPEDLLDVHDFIKATTTPAARKRLQVIGSAPTLPVSKPTQQPAVEEETPAEPKSSVRATAALEESEDSNSHDEAA